MGEPVNTQSATLAIRGALAPIQGNRMSEVSLSSCRDESIPVMRIRRVFELIPTRDGCVEPLLAASNHKSLWRSGWTARQANVRPA